MRSIGRIAALATAMLLLLVGAVGASTVSRQLARDRECSARMQGTAQRIEAYRAEHGRLPPKEELPSLGISALRFSTARDAHGRDAYRVSLWRGEWAVEYDSASGQDSCDSGAWKAGLWLAGVLLPLCAGLAWWGVRSPKRAG